ncbi:MAG: ribosome biogenesis GTPase [Parasphingorhabdus sp.]|jgi:ribosome biogenesis GTPase
MKPSLLNLGLSPFFTQQLMADEIEHTQFARIIEVQRSHVVASDGAAQWPITLGGAWFKERSEDRPTVGDWVLLNHLGDKILRLLDRKSIFKRIAAGNKVGVQLIAANVDTLFILTSCNEDFSESRLERYLSLADEAGVDPVIVLTKADLSLDPDHYLDRVKALAEEIPVKVVNATDVESLNGLLSWVTSGSTVALVGSSGVGKSSIVNSLSGTTLTATGSIREQDSKGKHTTSFRSLHCLPDGGILLDVPGMRELKVAELDSSIGSVFDDVEAFAAQCKYSNCGHNEEPNCAVRSAIDSGAMDQRRLLNYRKLILEEARNTASLAKQRSQGRQFGKSVKQHLALKKNLGKGTKAI